MSNPLLDNCVRNEGGDNPKKELMLRYTKAVITGQWM
jgi:hypothetical protein